MGDLTNKQIDQTYDGLIKTSDEQPINGTLKNLQDGVGNGIEVSEDAGEYTTVLKSNDAYTWICCRGIKRYSVELLICKHLL